MQPARFKIVTILLCLLVVALPLVNYAPIKPAEGANLEDLIKERDRLKRELDAKSGERQTIEGELAYTENQIRLNELEIQDAQSQIQNTESLIVDTNSKIDDLTAKLASLDESIKHTQSIADQRLRDAYKQSRVPEFSVLISADDFSGVMKTFAYLKAMEDEDNRVLGEMNENRSNYLEQKKNLENLKLEKQNLVGQLETDRQRAEVQQQELDEAKAHKDQLLSQVQGEESRYSQLLQMAQAQINIMMYNGSDVSYNYFGHFNRGQVVGYVGSTGCSTGPHAHYSYTTYYPSSYGWTGGAVDPMPRFYSGELYWVGGPNVGMYTSSPYGWRDGGFHNGADIPIGSGQPLYAAKSGSAYLKIIPMGAVRSFCPWWAPVNGPQQEIHLVHDDGSGASIYAHISDIASP